MQVLYKIFSKKITLMNEKNALKKYWWMLANSK